MIAPEFRRLVPVDLSKPCKKFIEENHGSELWTALQPSIEEFEVSRKEMANAGAYSSDVESLKKFKDMFANSYCTSMLMHRYFTFGPGVKQVNQKFIW